MLIFFPSHTLPRTASRTSEFVELLFGQAEQLSCVSQGQEQRLVLRHTSSPDRRRHSAGRESHTPSIHHALRVVSANRTAETAVFRRGVSPLYLGSAVRHAFLISTLVATELSNDRAHF